MGKLIFFIVFCCIDVWPQEKNISFIDHYLNISFESKTSIRFESKFSFSQQKDTVVLFFKNQYINQISFQNKNLSKVVKDSAFGKKVTLYSNNKNNIKDLTLTYTLTVKDSAIGRNYFYGNDHVFLLPDFDFIPDILHQNAEIKYHTTIKKVNNFSYLDEDFNSKIFDKPFVLMGNFDINEEDSLTTFIPREFDYNKGRLKSILKIVNSSLLYFKKVYGIPSDDKTFKIFFLNRSGGHGYPSGLILDQKYLTGGEKLNNRLKLLISHEVAHYWWGNNVKSYQSSLFEGLSEYSASLYMQEIEKYDLKNLYLEKNIQLETHPLNKIKFDTITPYDSDDNLYRTFSYIKLPIILRELECKIGKENLIKKLNEMFIKFKSSNEKISYVDFTEEFKVFKLNDELKNDIFGFEKEWTDFYIKLVEGSRVSYYAENLYNEENVLVKIISVNDSVLYENINFSKKKEVIKNYNFLVKRIIIDPNFETNQKTIVNDIYDSKKLDVSNSKCGKIYENKYYFFADNITEYLFYNDNAELKSFIYNDELILKIRKIATITRKIKPTGFLMLLDEKNKKIKIKISFITSTEKNIVGYIEFSYIEKDNIILLKSIDRVKL